MTKDKRSLQQQLADARSLQASFQGGGGSRKPRSTPVSKQRAPISQVHQPLFRANSTTHGTAMRPNPAVHRKQPRPLAPLRAVEHLLTTLSTGPGPMVPTEIDVNVVPHARIDDTLVSWLKEKPQGPGGTQKPPGPAPGAKPISKATSASAPQTLSQSSKAQFPPTAPAEESQPGPGEVTQPDEFKLDSYTAYQLITLGWLPPNHETEGSSVKEETPGSKEIAPKEARVATQDTAMAGVSEDLMDLDLDEGAANLPVPLMPASRGTNAPQTRAAERPATGDRSVPAPPSPVRGLSASRWAPQNIAPADREPTQSTKTNLRADAPTFNPYI